MLAARLGLGLACLLAVSRLGGAQSTDYYDDYELYTAGYHYDLTYDEGDTEGTYLNQYSGAYSDGYAEEDYDAYYFDDFESQAADCRIAENGKAKMNGTLPACDLKLEGADANLKGLAGGLDGVYELSTCQAGLPAYRRKDSKPNQDRVLWYSSEFRDWDISNGTTPQADEVLLYGGSGGREARPNFIATEWKVAAEFISGYKGTEDYAPLKISLACADGSKVEKPADSSFGKLPLFNDEEAQAQYSRAIQQGRSKHASAEVNLGLVTMLVMVGLGVVFGLPYMVARNRRRRRGGGNDTGLASILDLARKRGHTS